MSALTLISRGADGRTRPLKVGGVIHKGGGAGRICAVRGDPTSVVKLYHDPAGATHYKAKIEAMLARPPDLPVIEENGRRYVQIAWPTAIVENDAGDFLGFTMPFIDLARADSLDTLLIKALRRQRGFPENYAYRLFAALNVATMVTELHRLGHHLIDLKPQNLSVYKDNMYVAVIDCDGLSIDGGGIRRFPGHQYTDGYRAPEGTRRGLAPAKLGETQDRFALAVVLFQLLNNGIHPFQGVPRRQGVTLGTQQDRINAGLYAYGARENETQSPAPASIHDTFEDESLELFRRAFDSSYRPSAREWRDHLRELVEGPLLTRCEVNAREHAHFSKGCGLCRLDARVTEQARRGRDKQRTQAPRRKPRVIILGPKQRRYPSRRQSRGGTKAPSPFAWGFLGLLKWLWNRLRGKGRAPRVPLLVPPRWDALFFAYLVYLLYLVNLVVVAGLLTSFSEPRAFYWLADWLLANVVFPEAIDPSRRSILELVQVLVLAFTAISIILAMLLSYLNRGLARGSHIEGHSYWVTRSLWYFLLFALATGIVGGAFGHDIIAFFMASLTALWVIYRYLKGFYLLARGRPFANPKAIF